MGPLFENYEDLQDGNNRALNQGGILLSTGPCEIASEASLLLSKEVVLVTAEGFVSHKLISGSNLYHLGGNMKVFRSLSCWFMSC